MLETYHNLINYLFPVFIYKDADVLTIEDRRPSTMQLIFAAGGIFLLLFTIFSARALIETGYYWLLAVLIGGALLLIIKTMLEPFRERYIFDKRIDTYTFVRRGLLKSQTEQGSLSQFRAVQIERRIVSTDDGTAENYHVALLKNEGLLFGSPARAILREGNSQPIFSNLSSETRIAKAIASFLNFPSTEVIDG
jgi:hypothetical protein